MSENVGKKSETNLDQPLTFNAFLELLKDENGLLKLKEIHSKLIEDINKKLAKSKASSSVAHKKLTKSPSTKPKLHHLKLASAAATTTTKQK